MSNDTATTTFQFSELELSPEVLQAVEERGYLSPTPIQAEAIPIALTGRDLIGSAQTGTGKTAAFTLPMITRLRSHQEPAPRALILEPTRELAAQVDDNLVAYAKFTDLRKALVHGGVKYGGQLAQIEQQPDILVATPGRLIDHLQQQNVSLANVQMLVLDEVDRMLDMGFIDQVADIVRRCPKERQTLLFSATVPDTIAQLASWTLKDPVKIDTTPVGGGHTPAETIEHAVYPVDGIQKYDLLMALLDSMDYDSILIFTRMKIEADRISRWIEDHGHKVAVLHSDRTQGERKEALAGFKSGAFEIMVATDIAARGLDIAGITHVINFSVPQHPEDYVHRIGRTGRANREGEAATLFSTDETAYLEAIERYIGAPIERRKLEGFRYRNEPLLGAATKAPTKRNRGFGGGGGGRRRRR